MRSGRQKKRRAGSSACDDGKTCNGHELCAAGQCQAGQQLTCPGDGNSCTTAACVEGVGCQETWICAADAAATPIPDAGTAPGPDTASPSPDAKPVAGDGAASGADAPTLAGLDGATSMASLDAGGDGATVNLPTDGPAVASGDALAPAGEAGGPAGQDAGSGSPGATAGDASGADAVAADGGGAGANTGCSCSLPGRRSGSSLPAILLPVALVLRLRSARRRRR